MASKGQNNTSQRIYINILARTKPETESCVEALFPDQKGRIHGTHAYHEFPSVESGREAVESEDALRMHNLKERLSMGSSMETDSLPGYDDLYPDGGDAYRGQNGSSSNQDGHHQMTNLKTGHDLFSSDSLSSSLNSTATSSSITGTWSTDVQEPNKQYHVYEIPWESDRGLLWCTMPISQSVFVLVVDIDRKTIEMTGDYTDMLRSIDDLCKYKNVFEENEKPTLFLVGRTDKSGKDSNFVFQKSMKAIRVELMRHTQWCHIDDSDFLLMAGSPDLLQSLRFSLHHSFGRTFGQNIPLVSKIRQIISACNSCTITLQEIIQNLDCSDHTTVINTIKYMQAVGVLVYIESSRVVWTRPELLTAACVDLQQLELDRLPKDTIVSRCKDNLKLTQHEASVCLAALKNIGVLAEIPCTMYANNHNQTPVNCTMYSRTSQYLFSLSLKPGKDFFQTVDSSQKHTPVLRFSLRERKPHYVFCNMILNLLQKHWKPVRQGTHTLLNLQSVAFRFCDKAKPGSARIYLSTDRQNICVTIVSFTNAEFDPVECSKVREDVENAILATVLPICGKIVASSHIMECEIRCKDTKGALNGSDGWIDVESLKSMLKDDDSGICDQHHDFDRPHQIKPSELFQMWFPITNKELSASHGSTGLSSIMDCEPYAKKEDDRPLNDGLLSKVSKCIGSGWEMFFVENGVEQSDVDMAKADNPGQMTKQIYCCLRIWRDNQSKQEKKPTIKMLRDKVKKCDHLTINLDKLCKVMNEEY